MRTQFAAGRRHLSRQKDVGFTDIYRVDGRVRRAIDMRSAAMSLLLSMRTRCVLMRDYRSRRRHFASAGNRIDD